MCSRAPPPCWPLSSTLGQLPEVLLSLSPVAVAFALEDAVSKRQQRQAQLPGLPFPGPGPTVWKLSRIFKHLKKHSVQAFW